MLLTQARIDVTIDEPYLNKKLTIGDPFTITLTIKHPQEDMVSEPIAGSPGAFIVTEQENTLHQAEGTITSNYHMKLVPFETGELKIPSFTVIHTHADSTDTLTSAAIPITITSTLPEGMTDINDLKPAVEYPNFLPLIIAGIIVVGIVIAYIVFRLIKRYLHYRRAIEPPVPPWIEALTALETMPAAEWLQKGMIKRYYYALSEILKRYLERRFLFDALEQTTSEIVYHMKIRKIPLRHDFAAFFARADLVKYAKHRPPAGELEEAAVVVRSLVEKTKPTEAEEEKGPA